MPLPVGARLGPYEILGLIGAGGMGEVYKAQDTRLDRLVAIKVLPPRLTGSEDRARFEREARAIAGLSHPNICTLHDIGDDETSLFLVMELLTGKTLAERLRDGPLPLREALDVAADIADALVAAHRQGIVHRDLKPANVMLTSSGAKLLDFGLAKLIDRRDPSTTATRLSSGAVSLTTPGTVVGTLQYMAPEQIEGRAADTRTDLWALGAIVYEMVTGKRAFQAPSSPSLIAAILEHEPAPISTVQPLTPPGLDRLVRQCLAKSPDDRPETAHEVANELRWMREAIDGGVRTVRTVSVASLVVAAIGVLALAAAGALWFRRPPPPTAVVHSEIGVAPAEELNAGGCTSLWIPTPAGSRTAFAWTRDGRSLVFVGRSGGVQQLYARTLAEREAHPLDGTVGAQVPAVSPDGQWLAFWAQGALKKMPVAGGPVMDLVSSLADPPTGLVWDSAGRLFFGSGDGTIWQVSSDGSARPLTRLANGDRVHIPSAILPGDSVLLYTARKREWTWGDEDLVALEVSSGKRTVLLHDGADGRYVPTGHLVFMRRGTLLAAPFDTEHLAVTGPAVPIIEGLAQALNGWHSGNITGAGQFAIASNGSLAWVSGNVMPAPVAWLVTLDRSGRVTPIAAPGRSYGEAVHVSPDGRRLALTIGTLSDIGLWTYDLDREILTSIYRGGEIANPLWAPDGAHLVFRSLDGGRFSVKSLAIDSNAPPDVLVRDVNLLPSSWAKDRLLGVLDLKRMSVVTGAGSGRRVDVLRSRDEGERWPEVSPDGQWLAYASNASGRFDIYVEPYSGRGARIAVSADGGSAPAWNPSGRELFYVIPADADRRARMMSVDFQPGNPPRVGTPKLLFEVDQPHIRLSCYPVRCYDVSADGRRFYAVRIPFPPPGTIVTHINLVQNWSEELKAKVPAR